MGKSHRLHKSGITLERNPKNTHQVEDVGTVDANRPRHALQRNTCEHDQETCTKMPAAGMWPMVHEVLAQVS